MNERQRELIKGIHSGEISLPSEVRDAFMRVLSCDLGDPEEFFWQTEAFNVGEGFSVWLSGCKPLAGFSILEICWKPCTPTSAQLKALDQSRLNSVFRQLENFARVHYMSKYGSVINSPEKTR